MNNTPVNLEEPNHNTQTILHTKRDIAMVLLAVMILTIVTMVVYFTRLANATYDDHKDPKTSSLFHYEVNGF